MVSQLIRNEVWQEYLDVARLARYCDALANRNAGFRIVFRLILLLPLLTGLSILLDLLPNFVEMIMGGVVAIAVMLDMMFDFGN